MSITIPITIEPEVKRYAQDAHISTDEAVFQLIQAGLSAKSSEETRIQDLLGEPMNAEDAALMDEVVEMAMRARSERWELKGSA